MNRPQVLLADDHRMIAEGLKSLLAEEFEVVGSMEDGLALVASARKLRPDVIVADISMRGLNGLDALPRLKKDNPEVKVVFLTMHQNAAYARRALEAGAAGFVVKHSGPEELLMAINAALKGRTFITPALAGDVLRERRESKGEMEGHVTARQREILQLLADGRSAKEIANTLSISPRTVEFHKYQLMEAHGLHNSAELVHFAIKLGIVAV
jgi:DNA-binding NarL/FixJ family response regulator